MKRLSFHNSCVYPEEFCVLVVHSVWTNKWIVVHRSSQKNRCVVLDHFVLSNYCVVVDHFVPRDHRVVIVRLLQRNKIASLNTRNRVIFYAPQRFSWSVFPTMSIWGMHHARECIVMWTVEWCIQLHRLLVGYEVQDMSGQQVLDRHTYEALVLDPEESSSRFVNDSYLYVPTGS